MNNALAQISGRKRHNALTAVSEDSFNLFHQVNNLLEKQPKNFQFSHENLNDQFTHSPSISSEQQRANDEFMDDEDES